jgi:hypothetical protein
VSEYVWCYIQRYLSDNVRGVFRPAAWRLGVVLVQQKEKLLHGALRGSPARRIDVSRSLTLAMRHTPLTCGPATLPQWEDEPEHLVHTVGSATATVQHFTCRTEKPEFVSLCPCGHRPFGNECNDTFLQPYKLRLRTEHRRIKVIALTGFRRCSPLPWPNRSHIARAIQRSIDRTLYCLHCPFV